MITCHLTGLCTSDLAIQVEGFKSSNNDILGPQIRRSFQAITFQLQSTARNVKYRYC